MSGPYPLHLLLLDTYESASESESEELDRDDQSRAVPVSARAQGDAEHHRDIKGLARDSTSGLCGAGGFRADGLLGTGECSSVRAIKS